MAKNLNIGIKNFVKKLLDFRFKFSHKLINTKKIVMNFYSCFDEQGKVIARCQTIQEIEVLKKTHKESTIVFEAAVLIEAGWETIGTETWVIEVNPEVAIKRIMLRNKLSQSEAQARINSQLTNRERAAKADKIITNNDSTEEFLQKVTQCWRLGAG